MTDKQIIIDGVDVSGCEFFDSGNCVECDMRVHFYGDIPCDDECNRNCYYKQLIRKEQKFDKAKLLLQTIIETNKIYPLQNNLLKLLDIIEGKENE